MPNFSGEITLVDQVCCQLALKADNVIFLISIT